MVVVVVLAVAAADVDVDDDDDVPEATTDVHPRCTGTTDPC